MRRRRAQLASFSFPGRRKQSSSCSRCSQALVYSTPLDAAFTKPIASEHLAGLLAEKEIELVTEFNAGEVDGVGRKLVGYDGRELAFDLLVTIPLHGGAAYVERSPGLGDALGFVAADKQTLQSAVAPNVFALGDATDLPTSKAGSVTHFEAEVLAANVMRFFEGRELEAGYDGHANCFIETGFSKALLIDFTTRPSRSPGTSRVSSGCRFCASGGSTTSGSSRFSGSTGTPCSPAARSGDRPSHAHEGQEARNQRRVRRYETMTLIADAPVDVDAEGFLTDPEQWNEQIAEAIARENGIPELTDRHWLVVRFMRERYLATGAAPSIRSLGKESGVPIKSSTSSSPKGRQSSPPRSAASPAEGLHLERSER